MDVPARHDLAGLRKRVTHGEGRRLDRPATEPKGRGLAMSTTNEVIAVFLSLALVFFLCAIGTIAAVTDRSE